jgi:hypothetical protein
MSPQQLPMDAGSTAAEARCGGCCAVTGRRGTGAASLPAAGGWSGGAGRSSGEWNRAGAVDGDRGGENEIFVCVLLLEVRMLAFSCAATLDSIG